MLSGQPGGHLLSDALVLAPLLSASVQLARTTLACKRHSLCASSQSGWLQITASAGRQPATRPVSAALLLALAAKGPPDDHLLTAVINAAALQFGACTSLRSPCSPHLPRWLLQTTATPHRQQITPRSPSRRRHACMPTLLHSSPLINNHVRTSLCCRAVLQYPHAQAGIASAGNKQGGCAVPEAKRKGVHTLGRGEGAGGRQRLRRVSGVRVG